MGIRWELDGAAMVGSVVSISVDGEFVDIWRL